jgi:hypothetical protein
MKNKLYLVLAPILAAVLVYALFFRASDEDRIRQKLAALEVAMKSGASQSEAAARPLRIQKAFASIFTPRVRADIPGVEAGDTSREELAALASSTAAQVNGLDVAFNQVHLEIDARALPPRADVDALATVTGTTPGEAMNRRSVYQVTLHLEKIEGEWRVSRVAAALTN